MNLPPEAMTALAALHERRGRLERAADLYRTLATGSDRGRHLVYHREAGRLLAALGIHDDARRMWQRARALAEDDAETRAKIEADLAALGD
jgi:tetratricopeptide (TPR) repeat protein